MKPSVIKICGLMKPEEASFAAKCGATHIGMILWNQARRYVERERAKDMARVIKENGAVAVGVFVSGSCEEIVGTAHEIGIDIIQLSGSIVPAYANVIEAHYPCILATQIGVNESAPFTRSYLLYDNGIGGTGKSFCWESFVPPKKHPWILAGGLTPDNVGKAIRMLQPDGVDVSGGVEDFLGNKDQNLIKAFIEAVKREMSCG